MKWKAFCLPGCLNRFRRFSRLAGTPDGVRPIGSLAVPIDPTNPAQTNYSNCTRLIRPARSHERHAFRDSTLAREEICEGVLRAELWK